MNTILLVIFLVFVILAGFTTFDYYKGQIFGTNSSENSENTSLLSNDVDENEKITVKLTGCINKKGTYSIESGSFLIDVLNKAGGITSSADESCFNYYLILEADAEIYIAPQSSYSKVSLNDATVEELDELPGIGVTIANRMIEYREEIGEYTYLEELFNISGFGNSLFEKVKDKICL